MGGISHEEFLKYSNGISLIDDYSHMSPFVLGGLSKVCLLMRMAGIGQAEVKAASACVWDRVVGLLAHFSSLNRDDGSGKSSSSHIHISGSAGCAACQ
jgi:hypothetical protein